MEMLDLITLKVIDLIFTEAEARAKLSPIAKSLYVNCLIHNFRNKQATVANGYAFELEMSHFDRFPKEIELLRISGLVDINDGLITFNNVWGQKIDRTKLGAPQVSAHAIPGINDIKNTPSSFREHLNNSSTLVEWAKIKHGITQAELSRLIDVFVVEKEVEERIYEKKGDFVSNFMNWVNFNKPVREVQPPTKVVSSSKLLG